MLVCAAGTGADFGLPSARFGAGGVRSAPRRRVKDKHMKDAAKDVAQDVAEDVMGAAEDGSAKVLIAVFIVVFQRRNRH